MPIKAPDIGGASRRPMAGARLTRACAVFAGWMLASASAHAIQERSAFNSEFLRLGGGPQQVDLSVFSFGNRVLPGHYRATVIVNGESAGKQDVELTAASDDVDATPCLKRAQLEQWGVNVAAFESIMMADENACIDIAKAISQASVRYDITTHTLELSVPQAAMRRKPNGTVPIDQLDNGTNALMFSYQLSGSHDGRSHENSLYANLNAGLNLGAWRLRNLSAFNHDGRGSRWESRASYAERALLGLGSRLTIGDAYTPGNIFDSFGFRGVQMQTDETMRPDSMRGYAPTVRGIARSAAEVTIRQNGYVINKLYVPPGPFAIDDLYATPGAGDLEVTVTEADGSTTRYIQPYAALPTLVRSGLWNYSATVGRYRDAFLNNGPYVGQFTVSHGLTPNVTLYGGGTASHIYNAAALGTGVNLKTFGALSFDVTHARVAPTHKTGTSGSALRLTYAKSLPRYGTHFRMVGARYMTDGYRSFSQAVRENRYGRPGYGKLRTQLTASVAQQFGRYGALYVTATRQAYRDGAGADTLMQLGYSTAFRSASINLNYNEISAGRSNSKERQFFLNVSMPLGNTATHTAYQTRVDGGGRVNQSASIFGSMLTSKNLSYNAQLGKSTHGGSPNAYGSLYYQGSKGSIGVSHTQGPDYRQSQLSMGGAMVVDRKGALLTQSLGETAGIIEVPGAQGVTVDSYPGITTNADGRAVVPSLTPYRMNRVSVDASLTSAQDVDLSEAAAFVAPTRGALTYSTLRADVGKRVFARLRRVNGDDVPFGALVRDGDGREKSVVGPMGRVLLSGLKSEPVTYSVVWGTSAQKRCSFKVSPAEPAGSDEARITQITCISGEVQ